MRNQVKRNRLGISIGLTSFLYGFSILTAPDGALINDGEAQSAAGELINLFGSKLVIATLLSLGILYLTSIMLNLKQPRAILAALLLSAWSIMAIVFCYWHFYMANSSSLWVFGIGYSIAIYAELRSGFDG